MRPRAKQICSFLMDCLLARGSQSGAPRQKDGKSCSGPWTVSEMHVLSAWPRCAESGTQGRVQSSDFNNILRLTGIWKPLLSPRPHFFWDFSPDLLNLLPTTVLVSDWLAHARFPSSLPHFPPGLLEGDKVTQGLQEGQVVASICIQQVANHLHGPEAQVSHLDQVFLRSERRQGSSIVGRPT